MNILVTGGSGFIGSWLVKGLLDTGHKVTSTLWSDEPIIDHPNISYVDMQSIVHNGVPRFDLCFHQAAHNDTTCLERDIIFQANVFDPLLLFRALRRAGCERFIYASSTAVYGDASPPFTQTTIPRPLNPYAESKLEFDRFAKGFKREYPNCQVVGLRYCNVYGPGEEMKGPRGSMIGQILRAGLERRPIKLFRNGEQKRDWINVHDVVRINMLFGLRTQQGGGIFNVGTGAAHSFNEIVAAVNANIKFPVEVEWVDCPYPERYQSYTCCDISYLTSAIDFKPQFNLSQGIKSYVEQLQRKKV